MGNYTNAFLTCEGQLDMTELPTSELFYLPFCNLVPTPKREGIFVLSIVGERSFGLTLYVPLATTGLLSLATLCGYIRGDDDKKTNHVTLTMGFERGPIVMLDQENNNGKKATGTGTSSRKTIRLEGNQLQVENGCITFKGEKEPLCVVMKHAVYSPIKNCKKGDKKRKRQKSDKKKHKKSKNTSQII